MNAATTSARKGLRQPADGLSGRAPIKYRLPATESLAKTEETPEPVRSEFDDLAPLVLATSHAALVLFVTQAVATMLLANYYGASVGIRFIGNVVPYVALTNLNPTDLVPLVSYSTAASVVAVSGTALFALVRHRSDRQRLYGLASGLPMGASLLIFQYLRHHQTPPFIDEWVLLQCSALLVVVSVIFLGFKPTNDQTTSTSNSAART